MIVAEQKPLEEIQRMIAPYEKVLILGCGTCMTVCGAGGEREVSFLHSALRLAQARTGSNAHLFSEYTVKRQCDPEFMALIADRVQEVDAILSLGCGIGVQVAAEHF
ncbi:MAG: methylenetetrahydrofolate reductase C-terminal domain-containing protein, partial [Anaerolineae bacterium]